MKKYVIAGGVILLVIIGAIWMNAGITAREIPEQTPEEIPEDLEKCVCGECDLDIFNCNCPTAKEQREKLGV